MSKTYRRMKGCKWWGNQRYKYVLIEDRIVKVTLTREEQAKYEKEEDSKYRYRDKDVNLYSKSVKWHSNLLRRTGRREEISKLMKANSLEDMNYDPTKEISVKKLRWIYD